MRKALGFLTPIGGASVPTPATVRWFPAVGLLVGLAVGAVWRGAGELWTPAVAAALAVAADLALTGMLHLDGLVDSADGVLPHLDRARRLDVMSEPTVGAFGVVTAVAVLLLRWAALASLHADVWLVAGLWCLSRTLMATVLTSVPYARGEGLASAFRGRGGAGTTFVGIVVASVVVGRAIGTPTFAVLVAAWVGGSAVVGLAWRRLGGFTGDVLGAAGVVGETVGLVTWAAL